LFLYGLSGGREILAVDQNRQEVRGDGEPPGIAPNGSGLGFNSGRDRGVDLEA
jgi:hypothetical protein